MDTIRVVLADDHEIFLAGMSALLSQQPEIDVVYEAKGGREAVRAAVENEADVVLMDLSMQGMNGIEATRQICQQAPWAKVLCLSVHREGRFVSGALEAGAAGYLTKDCSVAEAMRAIRTVVAGRVYLSPAIARTVVDKLRTRRDEDPASLPDLMLTGREREVLQLIAEGQGTKEIADRLHISAKTVATHREHIMEKLDIHSIAGLTKYALRHGVTTVERHRRG